MSSQTLILPPAVAIDCPPWCDNRQHMGEFPTTSATSWRSTRRRGSPEHGDATVEVGLVQDPGERPRIVLFVSECDGSHGDEIECMSSDGESIELTPRQAYMVSRALSRAVSVLTDDSADILPSSLVRAA